MSSAASKPTQRKRMIRAVYGEMHDPTEGHYRKFDGGYQPLGEVTNWMTVQLGAGKLELDPDDSEESK